MQLCLFWQADKENVATLGDWNRRFQEAIETIRSFTVNTPLMERIEVNRDLIHLAQDFIYSSSTYGKIIISEVRRQLLFLVFFFFPPCSVC